jgi:hypothetical protein
VGGASGRYQGSQGGIGVLREGVGWLPRLQGTVQPRTYGSEGGRPMQIRSRFTLILGSQPHRMGSLRPSFTPLDTPRHTPLEIASTEDDELGMKEMQGVVGVWQGMAMDSLKLDLGPPHPTPLCPAGRSPLKRSLGRFRGAPGEGGFGDRVAGHQPQRV